jgi:rod shape-determining protein MreC
MLRRLSFIIPMAALLVVVVFLILPQNWKVQLQGVFLDVVGPVIRLYDTGHRFYDDVRGGFKSLDTAQKDARGLREQNAQLQTENNVLRNLQDENQRLREMLGFKQDSQFKLLACRVVHRDPSNWWNRISINRGWKDTEDYPEKSHLTSDLPVVTPRGVVGKTGAVGRYTTEVILMSDQNCSIAGTLEGSNDQGMIIGMGAPAEGRFRARMTFLPRDAKPLVGTRVFTGGVGGVFPPGLFLGTVLEVPPLSKPLPAAGSKVSGTGSVTSGSGGFGLYREIVVDPALDLTHLDELFIILPN